MEPRSEKETSNSEFDNVVNKLQAEIENKKIDDDWKRAIYSAKSQQFINDNNRIWSTGAILLPVSLGSFVVPATAKDASTLALVALGISATALIFFWNVIADNHRAFQNKSLAWMTAITNSIGISDQSGFKVGGGEFARRVRIQTVRQWLTFWVAIGWIVIIGAHLANESKDKYQESHAASEVSSN